MNGDGKADLAVTNGGDGTVSILYNNGDGTFAAEVDYAVGNNPSAVAIGDVNGDGLSDLAVANAVDNAVSVLIYKSNRVFKDKIDYPASTDPVTVTIGDVNGDGRADIVTGSGDSEDVAVLINIGDGAFASPVSYETHIGGGGGDSPLSTSLVDLNGDGKVDLVTADGSKDSMSVLLNNGDGTFPSYQVYDTGVGSNPVAVAVGDLNGDGKPDLATANQGNDTISVFINNGDGTFADRVDYEVGSGPSSIAIGDLNGDGKADLAVADFDYGLVSVLLNQAAPMLYAQAATGRVGIGTNNPDAYLNIFGSSGDVDLFHIATATNQNILAISLAGKYGHRYIGSHLTVISGADVQFRGRRFEPDVPGAVFGSGRSCFRSALLAGYRHVG